MGKKGIIGLSVIGLLCMIGLLGWSRLLLSSGKGTEKKEVSMSSQASGEEKMPVGTESVPSIETADTTKQESSESSKPSEQSKNSKGKKMADSDTAEENGTGSNQGQESKTGKKASGDKSSTGKKKDNKSNKNGKNGKDGGSSSGGNDNSSPSSTDSGHSDNSNNNGSDNAKPSQSDQQPTNKTHKVVVDGLTITSEQADCTVSGNTVTIKQAGTYTLSGRLSNGQVLVDTEKTSKVVIICKSMSLNCSHSAPFYVKSADKVTLQLAEGTTNTITDGASYTFPTSVKEPDAACYSQDDLTIEGSGSLIVTGKYQDGIASKNDIEIKQGNIQVTAVDDGIRGKDGIEISGGSVKVICESHAFKTTETKQSDKGIVEISGGSVHLDAVGDGIHATNQIKVSGGNTYIDAKNDGLDTDSSFLMTNGTLVIDGPKSSNHGIFDCKKGTAVAGGTFFAVGSSAMAKPLGTSGSQKALFYKADTQQATDTTVKIQNAAGKTVYQHKVTRKYQTVLYSSPDLEIGSYAIYCGSSKLGNCRVD